jgi:hypothetical protein
MNITTYVSYLGRKSTAVNMSLSSQDCLAAFFDRMTVDNNNLGFIVSFPSMQLSLQHEGVSITLGFLGGSDW